MSDKSIAELRLGQMTAKYESLYQTQQDYFACNKAQFPEKKKRLLNESKAKEKEMLAFIKQLRYENLI